MYLALTGLVLICSLVFGFFRLVKNRTKNPNILGLARTCLILSLSFGFLELGEKNQTLNLGQFAVKCYPYVEAGVFATFAPQERELVTSDLFD